MNDQPFVRQSLHSLEPKILSWPLQSFVMLLIKMQMRIPIKLTQTVNALRYE